MTKVLITGGAGFIGSNVAHLLVSQGHELTILDDLSAGKKENLPKGITFYKIDVRNRKAVEQVFLKSKPSAVIHAAAQIKVVDSMIDPFKDAEINISGGLSVLETARKNKVKKFVYLCTGGSLYGDPVFLPATEDHPINPLSCYGASKRAFEMYLHLYNLNYGLDFTSLRFSNVYGIRDDLKSGRVIPNFIKAYQSKKPVFITGDGKQGRDFIYVEDVAQAVSLALTKKTKDRYINIATQKVISINELFQTMNRLLGNKLKAKNVEKRLGEVQAIYLSNRRAKEQLGWQPKIEFEEGLKRTIEFFLEKV